jgi:hypothetical protein
MSLYNSYSSVLYLHLHCPFSLIGPYIRLRIFLSNVPNRIREQIRDIPFP